MSKETLSHMLDTLVNEQLHQIVLSRPADKSGVLKVRIRPIRIRGQVSYQAEELTKTQAFHKNMAAEELKAYIHKRLETDFGQADVTSFLGSATVLTNKKGTVTVKTRLAKNQPEPDGQRREADKAPSAQVKIRPEQPLPLLEHNRTKRYILPEGTPVPFLVDLGVMTEEGRIVRTRYDKFRQINRFLEFIEDILPKLDKTRESIIIDFGCGKSYLTFAMYYYLHEQKGYPIRIIGLDLKKDVILHCSRLAKRYGYEKLEFLHGDIASFEGASQVDMVVTLHACDTATDYALAKAVRWGAKVILSVPCCQHELNRTMKNELLAPVFQYGIIKERMAALYTDALRAQLLESQGYRTQILEFIDMEHTPKNLLIRAVKEGKKKENLQKLRDVMEFLEAEPTLYRLFSEENSRDGQ